MSLPTFWGSGDTTQHHDKEVKNGIPYALGLAWIFAYCRNCLVNRKTAIIVKMTLHVGIK
jgi:hypothetical protein